MGTTVLIRGRHLLEKSLSSAAFNGGNTAFIRGKAVASMKRTKAFASVKILSLFFF